MTCGGCSILCRFIFYYWYKIIPVWQCKLWVLCFPQISLPEFNPLHPVHCCGKLSQSHLSLSTTGSNAATRHTGFFQRDSRVKSYPTCGLREALESGKKRAVRLAHGLQLCGFLYHGVLSFSPFFSALPLLWALQNQTTCQFVIKWFFFLFSQIRGGYSAKFHLFPRFPFPCKWWNSYLMGYTWTELL